MTPWLQDATAPPGRGRAVDAHRLSRGDAKLLAHEIDTVHELRNRMFDLDARVHLEEVEFARRREQEFDRAGTDVPDRARRRRRRFRQAAAQRRRHGDRWRLLDQLLMAALDAAFALAQRDDAAMTVRQHLDLDVPRSLEILLDVDAAIAECLQGFPTRCLEPFFDLRLRADQPHAFAAASRDRFQQHGITDPLCFPPCLHRIAQRRRGPRNDGHAGGLHAAARFGLVAHRANRVRRRTDEHQSGFGARLRKRGAL